MLMLGFLESSPEDHDYASVIYVARSEGDQLPISLTGTT
jgi:hypothetical protein